jgi:hypothetical protein
VGRGTLTQIRSTRMYFLFCQLHSLIFILSLLSFHYLNKFSANTYIGLVPNLKLFPFTSDTKIPSSRGLVAGQSLPVVPPCRAYRIVPMIEHLDRFQAMQCLVTKWVISASLSDIPLLETLRWHFPKKISAYWAYWQLLGSDDQLMSPLGS